VYSLFSNTKYKRLFFVHLFHQEWITQRDYTPFTPLRTVGSTWTSTTPTINPCREKNYLPMTADSSTYKNNGNLNSPNKDTGLHSVPSPTRAPTLPTNISRRGGNQSKEVRGTKRMGDPYQDPYSIPPAPYRRTIARTKLPAVTS